MPEDCNYNQEPILGRESLFRQKLHQLRNTGEVKRIISNSRSSQFRQIEQSQLLNNVSSALEHADPKVLENLALLDTPTELYNHNTLCRVLQDEVRRGQRYKKSLALLAIALDSLPYANCSTDAMAFDGLLREAAQFLMKAIRDVDIPGRYDLNRLVIICPETNLDGALCLAGRLCSSIESENFSIIGKKSPVTISIGIATFPDLARSHEVLLHLAMQSLTIAKQSGGNTFKIGSAV